MGGDNASDIAALCLSAGGKFSSAGELFVGPATAGIDFPYLDKAMAAGILGGLGAVSVHPYRATPPDTALDDYVRLRALIEKYGATPTQRSMPILSGEWGYTTATLPCMYGNRCDELTQAAYLARMWLTNTLAGTTVSINYDWSDGNGGPADCESHFGSVRQPPTGNPTTPYTPKPKYMAALALQTGLGSFQRFSQRVTPLSVAPVSVPAGNVFILEFANGTAGAGQVVGYAAWTNGSNTRGACSPPGHPSPPGWRRLDCGHWGISRADCVSATNPKGPGCCWEPNVTVVGGPQCYRAELPVVTAVNITFSAAPGVQHAHDEKSACWATVDVLGRSLATVCADATGVVAVAVPVLPNATENAPVYLLPVQ